VSAKALQAWDTKAPAPQEEQAWQTVSEFEPQAVICQKPVPHVAQAAQTVLEVAVQDC